MTTLSGIHRPLGWLLTLPARVVIAPFAVILILLFGSIDLVWFELSQINHNPIRWFVMWPLRILAIPVVIFIACFLDLKIE